MKDRELFEEQERERERQEQEQMLEAEKELEAVRLAAEEEYKKEQQRIKEQEELQMRNKILEALPKCTLCTNPIEDEGVSSGGKMWHKACFQCTVCNKIIQGSFATQDGKLRCSSCHNQQTSKNNTCMVCGLALSGRVVRIDDPPVRLHKDCFKCADCEGSLEDGYFEKNSKFWCEKCINK